MLQKLKAFKFSEQTIQWFRSFRGDQIFLVETENKLSDFWKISNGVRQGFILGPLFCIVYINDMPKAFKQFALVC